ncbi:sugar isomerase domain-containing protein [Catellatospora tritici]|uniref:sugar isomerase domain-containing protein n=1 Tax=Catellatospora tritici TaxID=2851566 RepID=UPI001C2CE786|nr:SIS domain-containing protein [Catellatospora tritici]MBV1855324.1 SIS domain-containing protein [Catellatospora tritici]
MNAQTYLETVTELVAKVGNGQAAAVQRAADLITESLAAGGVVQAFGSGHSEAVAMEIAGRAGGLVPTNRIALRDIVLYGGEPREVLEDQLLERRVEVAHRLYELAPIEPADVFVLASQSGINGVIVELALLIKERGHKLIAVTSLEHTAGSEPRHPSGRRLAEIADVVLDNGAPYGDVVLANQTGAVSSVTAAVLAQMVVAEVVERLERAGQTPPIYLSANIAGGYEHNLQLEARYAGRIRRIA